MLETLQHLVNQLPWLRLCDNLIYVKLEKDASYLEPFIYKTALKTPAREYVSLCQFLTQSAPDARKEFQQFGENHPGVKDSCGVHALKSVADKSQHYRLGFQGLQTLPSYLKKN